MIDLHLHTTASDGALAPPSLVERALDAGITTLAVTDHDTVAGLAAARAAAESRGARFVDGIEITAVLDGRDVHLLGYFIDPSSPRLAAFLTRQRADRLRRLGEIAHRLASLGLPIDAQPIIDTGSRDGRSVGRPHVARALVAAGYVTSIDEAFQLYLREGKPAFVARCGPAPDEVIAAIRDADGIVSLAHPALTAIDPAIPGLAAVGLDALEVRHRDHDAAAEARYRALAASLRLACTAGSDFHGDDSRRPSALGTVTMSPEELTALEGRRR